MHCSPKEVRDDLTHYWPKRLVKDPTHYLIYQIFFLPKGDGILITIVTTEEFTFYPDSKYVNSISLMIPNKSQTPEKLVHNLCTIVHNLCTNWENLCYFRRAGVAKSDTSKNIELTTESVDWVNSTIFIENLDLNLWLRLDPRYLNNRVKYLHHPVPIFNKLVLKLSQTKNYQSKMSATYTEHGSRWQVCQSYNI